MKKRKYTQGMTLFVTPEMYRIIVSMSDEQGISVSELIRGFINPRITSVSADKFRTEDLNNGNS